MSVEGDASTEPLSVVQFGDAASSDVVIAVEHMRFIAHRQHLS
jgi:hypothetical protein